MPDASASGKRCSRFKVTPVKQSFFYSDTKTQTFGETLLNETRFLEGISRREEDREKRDSCFIKNSLIRNFAKSCEII